MDIQDVDRREVLRYLGYRGQEADGAVAAMVEQSMAELWEAATPRHLYREYPLSLGEDYRIDGGCFNARSRNLWGNLKDCDQIIVFAATLGCGADHLIQKYSRLQMSRAVVMQAAAAAMIPPMPSRFPNSSTWENWCFVPGRPACRSWWKDRGICLFPMCA